MYTDPEGEFLNFVIGAVVGFVQGMIQGDQIALAKGATGWARFGYIMAGAGIGAGIGALTAGIGAGVSSAMAPTGTFAAGFMGTQAAVTTTGFIAGAAAGAAAGAVGGALAGAGYSWLSGNSFEQGILDGLKGGVIGGVTGGIIGGIMGGIDAALDKRNFFTGNSKTYQLQRNQIASADGTMIYEEYITPPGKPTVVNTDSYDVYYQPEGGRYGIDETVGVVKPGYAHYSRIDGVATSKYPDAVFKVPNWGRVKVLPGGDVVFLNPNTVSGMAHRANILSAVLTGQAYEYGWMPLSKLDSGWAELFRMALIIKP